MHFMQDSVWSQIRIWVYIWKTQNKKKLLDLLTLQLSEDGMSFWINFLVEENKAVVLLLDYVVQHFGIHLEDGLIIENMLARPVGFF